MKTSRELWRASSAPDKHVEVFRSDLSLSPPIAVLCTSNELIGDIVEIVADDARLGADT